MNWLVKHGAVRPWWVIRIQLRILWKWISNPRQYFVQQTIHVHHDVSLIWCRYIVFTREYVYIAWRDTGEVEYINKEHPTYQQMLPIINKLHGRFA